MVRPDHLTCEAHESPVRPDHSWCEAQRCSVRPDQLSREAQTATVRPDAALFEGPPCRSCLDTPAVFHPRCGRTVCSRCAAESPVHCPHCGASWLEVPDLEAMT
jgi:hypothetical protein